MDYYTGKGLKISDDEINRQMMKFDGHGHTSKSYDVAPNPQMSPFEVYKTLKKRGAHFVTITDHNTIDAHRELEQVLPSSELETIVRGVEVTLRLPRNVLHINVYDFTDKQYEGFMNIQRSAMQRPENVHWDEFFSYLENEGLPYQYNHPFDFPESHLLTNTKRSLQQNIKHILPDLYMVFKTLQRAPVVELNYFRDPQLNDMTRMLARQLNKPVMANTDSHDGMMLVHAYNLIPKTHTFRDAWKHILAGKHYVAIQGIDEQGVLETVSNIRDLVLETKEHRLDFLRDWVNPYHYVLFPLVCLSQMSSAFRKGLVSLTDKIALSKAREHIGQQHEHAQKIGEYFREQGVLPAYVR